MDTLQLNLTKRYTFADYLTWFDDKRRELIEGFIKMFPAPVRKHQKFSSELHGMIWTYLRYKKCEIYSAPFDVRLPKNGYTDDNKIYNVVQPDISIICDPKKLDERGCIGAPDMIIEIASKSTAKNDTDTKFKLYEQHGVKEYWIARPHEETITVFLLDKNGKYQFIRTYPNDTEIPVNIFNGDLIVDLKEIFREDEFDDD